MTYADLEAAPAVVLVGLEPEEESPIVFLRLRKAVRKRRTAGLRGRAVRHARRSTSCSGTLIAAAPGDEAAALDALAAATATARRGARAPRRGASCSSASGWPPSPGALSAAARLADATGARLAWVPRRAGERGALEAGCAARACCPAAARSPTPRPASTARRGLGRRAAARRRPGRDTAAIVAAAAAGELGALLVGGVDPDDLPDPQAALAALDAAAFVVSLEVRALARSPSGPTSCFPVAAGRREGRHLRRLGGPRPRPFEAVISGTNAMADHRVLAALADELGVDARHRRPPPRSAASWPSSAPWDGARAGRAATSRRAERRRSPAPARPVLATWRMLLDLGRGQDGEPHLAGTARAAVARLSPATAAALGAADGDLVDGRHRPRRDHPAAGDHRRWPTAWSGCPPNSAGSRVRTALAADAGDRVRVARAAATTDQEADA